MSSSENNVEHEIRAKRMSVTDDRVTIEFKDGRIISVPTKWFPRLLHGTPAERAKFEIWMDGIYWPKLNADVSYKGLLQGCRSGESAKSFRRWLGYRARGMQEPILTLPVPPGLAKFLKRERQRKPARFKPRRHVGTGR